MELTLGMLVEKGVGPATIATLLDISHDEAKHAVAQYRATEIVRATKSSCCSAIMTITKCDAETASAVFDAVSAQIIASLPRRGRPRSGATAQ